MLALLSLSVLCPVNTVTGGGVPEPWLDFQADAGISEAIGQAAADWVAADGQTVEQSTAGARPTHVSVFTVGHGLSFDGGDYLWRDGSLVTDVAGSLLVVFQVSTAGVKQVLVSQSDQDSANNWFEVGLTAEDRPYLEYNASGTVHRVVGSSRLEASTSYVLFLSHNGTDYFMNINGVEENPLVIESVGTVGWFGDVTSIDTFTIGATLTSGGAARHFTGMIGALQLWDTDITT